MQSPRLTIHALEPRPATLTHFHRGLILCFPIIIQRVRGVGGILFIARWLYGGLFHATPAAMARRFYLDENQENRLDGSSRPSPG